MDIGDPEQDAQVAAVKAMAACLQPVPAGLPGRHSYLWLALSYKQRPDLESPGPRVPVVLCASSHGTGALGGLLALPG